MIPERIAQDLIRQQHRSELLVTAVQLCVIFLLSIVYYVAPRGYTADAPVHSAPLGLSLFAILVLFRLWFAYTRQLNAFWLGFSVVAEMALLLFTIWTYHLQFEEMASINLKNTHIAYVFVLIALRALRFEPLWVILSGLTAALGWSLIVWHTLYSVGTNIITWDYVTYASTRSFHPGSEFDKVLAILLVTFIIAAVLKRARNTLFKAVTQTHAARDLARFFDSGIATKITQAEKYLLAGQGEIRHAAILFTDLRGFTKASALLSPSELIAFLGEYQHLLVPIIQKHGGNIDKFMGDGILASFGAVSPTTTYAANALAAVDSIMEAVEIWSKDLQQRGRPVVSVGAGLAVGEVVFGIIGNEDRLEYTVIGEAVNLAAKLEKHNKAENVKALATLTTLELAEQQGYAHGTDKEKRYGRCVAGVSEPVDLIVIA
jgi:adenylate cyclase